MIETAFGALEGQDFVLSSLAPSLGQKRLALGVVLFLLVAFSVIAGPLSTIQPVTIEAFFPIYVTAMLVSDLITAVLLFAQFSVLRSRALLAISSGYLFTALILIPWILAFPGVFAPSGLLGAEVQSASWLYIVWHAGFPMFTVAYALLKDRDAGKPWQGSVHVAILSSAAVTTAIVLAATLLVTVGHELLPPIVLDAIHFSPLWRYAAGFAALLNVFAVCVLWARRRSVLDLWLTVVMCGFAIEVCLVPTRYSVGWYCGKICGLLSGSLVLFVLLFEITRLYGRLLRAQKALRANEQELRKARDELEIKVAERTAELRQSERELRDVIDTIPAIVWSAQPDGSNTYVNKRFVEYSGSSAEQMAGSGWKALIHPDDLERHAGKWMEAVATGKPHENEVRSRRLDGQYRWQLDRGVPLRDEDGNIVKWYGVTTDIEDRKRAEETREVLSRDLQESKAKLEEAQRITHVGYWEWDISTGRVNWSDETYRIYGMRPQERPMDIATCQEKIHAEDWQRGMEEALGGARFNAECRVFRPTGEVRIAHFQGDVKRDTSGQPYQMFGTIQDITDRKSAEDKIREQERELRQILDLVPQLVSVFGPGGERLYANRIGLDYIGLSLEEWQQTPGNGFSSPAFFHPDDRERAARTYSDNARPGGSAFELELRLRKRDGTYRWFLVRFNPLRDEQGQITRWYSALTDIEDRKRAEDRLRSENVALREEIDKASMFEEIVGTSPALKSVLSRICKVARSDSTVLINGETGTGKELVARAIHRRSDRASRAFVSVNCAAIPHDLIASELFGHEKGAFTGATQQRLGRFELANGGTLFLDEVGELPAETQIALLRVLQEHEFERVGGTRPIRADVRVIAATNRNLQAAISAGSFRSDLFYRLHVFPIEIPPLRERKQDIPLLVQYFIDRYARKAGKPITTVETRTLQVLQSYPWPGNIRELQNVIERSVIVCETENFSVDESWLSRPPLASEPTSQFELSRKFADQEKEMIEAALRESRGRVSGSSGAAAKLGIPGSTLESKIRSLNINKNHFKTNPSAHRT